MQRIAVWDSFDMSRLGDQTFSTEYIKISIMIVEKFCVGDDEKMIDKKRLTYQLLWDFTQSSFVTDGLCQAPLADEKKKLQIDMDT